MRTSLFFGLALALGSGGLLVSADTAAQSIRAMRAQAEGSMVLSGSIDIAVDGSVEGFQLADEAKVEPYIKDFVKANVASWRFEPVMREGKAVRARTPVYLRLLATAGDEGRMQVALKSASFEAYDSTATDSVVSLSMTPPQFPKALYEMGGAGEVALLLKINREGGVEDVIAEQVNVSVLSRGQVIERMRDIMARNSLAAARKWRFRVPTTGEAVDEPYWTVRVPVNYSYDDARTRYGKWQAYVPGPRNRASWDVGRDDGIESADTLPDGGVYMVGLTRKGPKLLTRLEG